MMTFFKNTDIKDIFPDFRNMTIVLCVFLLLISLTSAGQTQNKLFRKGNDLYHKGKFSDAEVNYRKGLELEKGSVKGRFNLGDALYEQKKYKESASLFDSLNNSGQMDQTIKAKILHNLGNSLLESKEYDKSIQAYKQSLINNPKDRDTKYNLEYAKMMLKKQQQQQQQQQKDQKKDQQKKDQQKQEQKKENQDQQQAEKKDQQQDPKKISKEDAERMLEALKNDEKKTMQKVRKEKAKSQQPVSIEKDW